MLEVTSYWLNPTQKSLQVSPLVCLVWLLLRVLAMQVKGVILDPSCSGSGTTVSRMDHLLPGSSAGPADGQLDEQEQQRVEQLAKFQVGDV